LSHFEWILIVADHFLLISDNDSESAFEITNNGNIFD